MEIETLEKAISDFKQDVFAKMKELGASEVGRRIGSNRTYASRLLSGRQKVSIEKLFEIAKAIKKEPLN